MVVSSIMIQIGKSLSCNGNFDIREVNVKIVQKHMFNGIVANNSIAQSIRANIKPSWLILNLIVDIIPLARVVENIKFVFRRPTNELTDLMPKDVFLLY